MAFLRQLDLWMTFDGVTLKICFQNSGPTPYLHAKLKLSTLKHDKINSWTYSHKDSIHVDLKLISNILIYLNVLSNRTPLMTFDPNKPTCIMLTLLQGTNIPHMNLIHLCIKKIWTTQKECTKSLTDWLTDWLIYWHTVHATIRSFLTDDLKIVYFWLAW